MSNKKRSKSKILFIVTFITALIALIAGLLLPVTLSSFTDGINFGLMPVLQLGGALNAFGFPIKFGTELGWSYSYTFSVFGRSLNVGAALLIFYAISTAVALALLLPALLSTPKRCKKIIFFSEMLALTPLFAMNLAELYIANGNWNFSVILPFAVVMLCVIIQSFAAMRGSGVIKFILFSISAAILLLATTDLAAIIPASRGVISAVTAALKGSRPFAAGPGLFVLGGQDIYGSTLFKNFNSEIFYSGAAGAAVGITLSAVAVVALNLYFDMLGFGKKTNGFMLVCNVIRYSLELILLTAAAISVLFTDGNYGIMLYLLLAACVTQLIIQIARLSRYKGRKKNKSASKTYKRQHEEYSLPALVPVANTAMQSADSFTPTANDVVSEESYASSETLTASPSTNTETDLQVSRTPEEPAEIIDESKSVKIPITDTEEFLFEAEPLHTDMFPDANVIEESPIQESPPFTAHFDRDNLHTYNGPTDEFIQKLSDEEKTEFAQLFIDNKAVKIANMPDYVVGGDNSRFFSFLFIYFPRIRNIVTDGLINKFYEQVNLI